MPNNRIIAHSAEIEYFNGYVQDYINRKIGFQIPFISKLLMEVSKSKINPSNFNLLEDEISKIKEAFAHE